MTIHRQHSMTLVARYSIGRLTDFSNGSSNVSELDYPYIGLLNPENILDFTLEWLAAISRRFVPRRLTLRWTRRASFFRTWDSVFKAGGALPGWLGPDNPYKFLWGADPEKVYRRRYPEQWYLRVVARLIACFADGGLRRSIGKWSD